MQIASILGMDRETGKSLSGADHVRQSILDILTTSPGERVCNRTYGSDLMDAIDQPIGPALVQYLYAATAIAIADWYPFVTLGRVEVEQGDDPASLNILITGEETAGNGNASPFALAIPLTLTAPIFEQLN
jgi:uncharacterized protein